MAGLATSELGKLGANGLDLICKPDRQPLRRRRRSLPQHTRQLAQEGPLVLDAPGVKPLINLGKPELDREMFVAVDQRVANHALLRQVPSDVLLAGTPLKRLRPNIRPQGRRRDSIAQEVRRDLTLKLLNRVLLPMLHDAPWRPEA